MWVRAPLCLFTPRPSHTPQFSGLLWGARTWTISPVAEAAAQSWCQVLLLAHCTPSACCWDVALPVCPKCGTLVLWGAGAAGKTGLMQSFKAANSVLIKIRCSPKSLWKHHTKYPGLGRSVGVSEGLRGSRRRWYGGSWFLLLVVHPAYGCIFLHPNSSNLWLC